MEIKIGDKFNVIVCENLFLSLPPNLFEFEIEIVGIYYNSKNTSSTFENKKSFHLNFYKEIQFIYKGRFEWEVKKISLEHLKELILNTEDYKLNNRFPINFDLNFKEASYYD